MAPEKNLVLYDCVFDKVEFPADYGTSFRIFHHFKVFEKNLRRFIIIRI